MLREDLLQVLRALGTLPSELREPLKRLGIAAVEELRKTQPEALEQMEALMEEERVYDVLAAGLFSLLVGLKWSGPGKSPIAPRDGRWGVKVNYDARRL
ncbi:hypothetical protein KKH13_04970 [Patescibacteria group bacterium]|nr:hypothetical protein [Patescibacteria group bacterium]